MKSLLLIAVFATPLLSMAVLDINVPRGEKMIKYKTPNNREELCVLPQHSGLGKYTKEDLKIEQELCSYDFHGLSQDNNAKEMVTCAKSNSTNPGVLIMDVPKQMSKDEFEKNHCFKKSDLSKTRAKFKQTVTCSYTPSLLTYYHFSRYLDGAGRVPVAVLRTMEKEKHLDVVKSGLAGTQQAGGVIHGGWKTLAARHQNPLAENKTFDLTGQFIFGALQDKTTDEAVYNEINGGGEYEKRYENFVKKDFYQTLKDTRNIFDILGTNEFEKVAQKILMLKDATDLILIDTLLTQNDRMYNLHYKWAWLWREDGEIKIKIAKADLDKNKNVQFTSAKELEEKAKYEAKGAMLVKQMVLKDNDCGVNAARYGNKMNKVHALAGIRRMSGRTYTALMKLNQQIHTPEMGEYLKNETLMNDHDLKVIRSNVSAAAADLSAKCRNGILKLDLDLESYFAQNPTKFSCDI